MEVLMVVGGGGIFFENWLQTQEKYVTARILEVSRPFIFSSAFFYRRTDCQNLQRKQIYTAVR
jgi:hypothetical protein